MSTFPLQIPMARRAHEEFQWSEEGSYEDASAESTPAVCPNFGCAHVFTIIRRRPNHIEVHDATEATCVYVAAASGTLQIHHLKVATDLCDLLREYVPAEWVALWPAPAGV